MNDKKYVPKKKGKGVEILYFDFVYLCNKNLVNIQNRTKQNKKAKY